METELQSATPSKNEGAASPASAMRRQVYSLPQLIRDEIWEIEARTRKAISTPALFSLRSLVITGSGDSFMAAQAAAPAFVEFAGIIPHVQTSLQAARYTAPALGPQPPNTPLVLAVSNSGEAARLVEAVLAFNRQGALTVALTANPQSRLGQAARICIPLRLPPFDAAPGVRSYVVSLLALQMMAIRFAEVRGRMTMDTAMALRNELAGSADAIEGTLAEADAGCRALAERWRDLPAFELLSGGPNLGTAAYGAAKILEAAGRHAAAVDTEEWNHLNYFVGRPEETATLLFSGATFGAQPRAREVGGYLPTLGRPWASLGDEPLPGASAHLTVHCPLRESLSPVVYTAPVALLAAYLNEITGEAYGRGSTGRWSDSHEGAAVRHSAIDPSLLPASQSI